TLAQRLIYGGATDGSLWVSVFEAAYLQLRAKEKFDLSKNVQLVKGSFYETVMTDKGETVDRPFQSLTGYHPHVRSGATFTNTTEKELIRQFAAYARSPRLFTVSILGNLPKDAAEKGLITGHAYAVIGWTPGGQDGGTITLRNPHNTSAY